MTNYHCWLNVGECTVDVVGEALGSHAHHILVHTVGAGAHDATKTTCTELEVLIECLDEVGLVLVVKHCLYGSLGFVVETITQPSLCFGCTVFNKLFVHDMNRFIRFGYEAVK